MRLPSLSGIFTSLAPRVIGVACAGLATYISAKSKGSVVMDPTQLTELIMTALGSYVVGHRASSTIINPGDASTGRIAEAEKTAADLGTTVRVAPKQ